MVQCLMNIVNFSLGVFATTSTKKPVETAKENQHIEKTVKNSRKRVVLKGVANVIKFLLPMSFYCLSVYAVFSLLHMCLPETKVVYYKNVVINQNLANNHEYQLMTGDFLNKQQEAYGKIGNKSAIEYVNFLVKQNDEYADKIGKLEKEEAKLADICETKLAYAQAFKDIDTQPVYSILKQASSGNIVENNPHVDQMTQYAINNHFASTTNQLNNFSTKLNTEAGKKKAQIQNLLKKKP